MDNVFLPEQFENSKAMPFHHFVVLNGEDAAAGLLICKGVENQKGRIFPHLVDQSLQSPFTGPGGQVEDSHVMSDKV